MELPVFASSSRCYFLSIRRADTLHCALFWFQWTLFLLLIPQFVIVKLNRHRGETRKKRKNMKLMSHCALSSLQKKKNNAVIYLTCTGGFSVATNILLVCKIFLMWIRTAYIKLQISHNYYVVSKSTVVDLYYRPHLLLSQLIYKNLSKAVVILKLVWAIRGCECLFFPSYTKEILCSCCWYQLRSNHLVLQQIC